MITRRTFLLASGVVITGICPLARAIPQPFVLTIARKFSSATCTSGYLAVNGRIICYTLEKPWQGNKTDLSSIPVGQYQGTVRYDHDDKWRIELQDVADRTHIEIHTGNLPADSKGCILLGIKLTDDSCGLVGGTSKAAYDKLREAFYGSPNPIATPDKSIQVNVED